VSVALSVRVKTEHPHDSASLPCQEERLPPGKIPYQRLPVIAQCSPICDNEPMKPTDAMRRAIIRHANKGGNEDGPPIIPTRAKAKGRPPRRINWQLADVILARLAEGESLRDICRSKGYPKEATIREWAIEDNDFGAAFLRARAIGFECNAEELEHWASNQPADNVEAQWQRTRIETRKWLLAKRLPQVFGDVRNVQHSGGIALQVVTGVPIATTKENEVADQSPDLSREIGISERNLIADDSDDDSDDDTLADDSGGNEADNDEERNEGQ
jgi:hypothetical protein